MMLDCYKCKGKGGFIYWKPSDKREDYRWAQCPVCRGYKKLDWIENAMGGKREISFDSHNVCIGYQAGISITTGQNNIAIGFNAGISTHNPITIGSKAKV